MPRRHGGYRLLWDRHLGEGGGDEDEEEEEKKGRRERKESHASRESEVRF